MGCICRKIEAVQPVRRASSGGITYEGRHYTAYEATQQRGRIESGIRRQKRRVLVSEKSGDADQLLADRIKLARLNQEYSRFCKVADLKTRPQRLQQDGFGRSAAGKAAASYRKELEKYRAIHYNKNGTIVVTDDWKSKGKATIPQKYKPNAVVETQTAYKNGIVQIDRTIYDDKGMLFLQIHSGPHNRPDKHPFGKHGEHIHRYTWGDDGKLTKRDSGELSDLERIQHQDILGGEEAES